MERKGWGSQKGITGLKVKRGKLRTRPLADRSACLKLSPGIKAAESADIFAKCKIYANPINIDISQYFKLL